MVSEVQMTRKQAILRGISILSKNKKNQEIVDKLKEIFEEYPYKTWTKKAVFDSIEQFRIEHNGRYPNIKEFEGSGLPSHSSIKNLFGVSVSRFLDIYYPNRLKISNTRYNNQSPYYWMEQFKKTYLSINNGKYVSEYLYDKNRKHNSPCIQTLIKIMKVKTYKELLHLAMLDKHQLTIKIKY